MDRGHIDGECLLHVCVVTLITVARNDTRQVNDDITPLHGASHIGGLSCVPLEIGDPASVGWAPIIRIVRGSTVENPDPMAGTQMGGEIGTDRPGTPNQENFHSQVTGTLSDEVVSRAPAEAIVSRWSRIMDASVLRCGRDRH